MRQRSPLSPTQFFRSWLPRLGVGILTCGTAVASPLPAAAVETITVELGPAQTSLYVSDLETFARTGHVPARLGLYQSWLTPTVQATLQNHLIVEPVVRDRVLQDLLNADKGQPFAHLLASVTPDLSIEEIQTALKAAEANPAGVTAISVLKALPGDTLTIKGGALLQVLAQFGLSHLEQTALSKVLHQELIGNSSLAFSPQFEPSAPGHLISRRWSVSFRDHERDRVIPVDLYWSSVNPGPLVVLSHGFGADRHFLDYLAQHLASHGITVLTLEHPGSNVNALISQSGSVLPPEEFVERPRDVSFILDQIEDLNKNSFFFKSRLNLKNVTLIGHSLGGYTGLVLAGGRVDPVALASFCKGLEVGTSSPADWFQCAAADAKLPPESLADPRITQLVLMNPLGGQVFGEDGLEAIRIPTLVVTSTRDGIASISDQQLRSFSELSGPRSLVAIIGGTHLSVGDPANINPALTQVPFMPERPEEETSQLRQYLNGVVLSFVMQQTAYANQYKPYLTPEYAQLFSTGALPIRYSDRLPSSLNHWLTNRDRLSRRLTPTLKSLASLAHLEWIGAKARLTKFQREAIAHLLFWSPQPTEHLSRSPQLESSTPAASFNRESSHPVR